MNIGLCRLAKGLLLICLTGCKLAPFPGAPTPGGKIPPDNSGGDGEPKKEVEVVGFARDYSNFYEYGRSQTDSESFFPNTFAFAALKSNGSVVIWGDKGAGGEISAQLLPSLASDVLKVYSNTYAFAATKKDGTVVTWGSASNGGEIGPSINSIPGFSKIFSTQSAFAATRADGSYLTAWGDKTSGGSIATLDLRLKIHISAGQAKVKKLVSTGYSFAALIEDTIDKKELVVSWGQSSYGSGAYDKVRSQLEDGQVEKLFAGGYDFAAIKKDGSVITWPLDTTVNLALKAPPPGGAKIFQIFSSLYGFAGLKTNGEVVYWGNLSSDGLSYVYPPIVGGGM